MCAFQLTYPTQRSKTTPSWTMEFIELVSTLMQIQRMIRRFLDPNILSKLIHLLWVNPSLKTKTSSLPFLGHWESANNRLNSLCDFIQQQSIIRKCSYPHTLKRNPCICEVMYDSGNIMSARGKGFKEFPCRLCIKKPDSEIAVLPWVLVGQF